MGTSVVQVDKKIELSKQKLEHHIIRLSVLHRQLGQQQFHGFKL